MKEAKSNIEFLRILVEPSAELDKCGRPSQIEEHLMLIVHLFRTIWLNAPYYNSEERIENLFKALSNQIIILCRDYIDFREMFAGKTRTYMDKFKESIEACESYKSLYDRVIVRFSSSDTFFSLLVSSALHLALRFPNIRAVIAYKFTRRPVH